MDFVNKNFGPVNAEVGMENGAIVAKVSLPVVALLDKGAALIKGKIPGNVDDAIIDLVVAALKTELSK